MRVTGIPGASSFAVLLEESGIYDDDERVCEPNYLSAETDAPRVGARRMFCQGCGNFAKYKCTRCQEPFCCQKCYTTHNEVRCLKFNM